MLPSEETEFPDESTAHPGTPGPRRLVFLGIALGLGALILLFLPVEPPEGKSAGQVRTGLAILALAGVLWLTEALPLAVTALLVPVAGVIGGVFPGDPKKIVTEAFVNFAHPLIFLFLGGFGIAAALSRQGLNRWIADRVLAMAGGHFHRSAIGLFLVAGMLSMWISNTATTALLFPVALGIIADLEPVAGRKRAAALAPFLLLGLAYSASLGGLGTLIGTAPNAIAAAQLGLDFTDWLRIGLPCVAVLLPCMIAMLFLIVRPGPVPPISLAAKPIRFTAPRVATLGIFLLAVAGWLAGGPLSRALGVASGFDSIVAVSALVLLAACGLVTWKDVDRTTDWGVLLLFGGGLTLSKILALTGASTFLAGGLQRLTAGWPIFLLVGAVVLFVIFLTEVSSNTATTALFVPIFYQVAVDMGIPPTRLVLPLTVAASCAFMLPIATPPNAIVFGSGRIPQRTMMRIGLGLNLVIAAVLTVLSSLLF